MNNHIYNNITLYKPLYTNDSIAKLENVSNFDNSSIESKSIEFVSNNNTDTISNIDVQRLAAKYTFYATLSQQVPVIILAYPIGTWSDTYFSKSPYVFILTILGGILSSIYNAYLAYNPNISIHYTFVGPLIFGVCGGSAIHMLCCFSYLSHLHQKNERTVRFAIFDTCGLLGILIGSGLGSILLTYLTLPYIFICIGVTYAFALGCLMLHFGIFYRCMKLSQVENVNTEIQSMELAARPDNFTKGLMKYLLHVIMNPVIIVLSWISNAKLINKIANHFDKNSDTKRHKAYQFVICVCLTKSIITSTTSGEFDTLYLYAVRRFDWTAKDYANLLLVWKICGVLSLVPIFSILKKTRNMSDYGLAIVGIVSKAFGIFLIGISPTGPFLYFGYVFCLHSKPI